MTLEFFLPMVPPTVTQQEHKVMIVNGKVVFYDPPELKKARNRFTAELKRHAPDGPMRGAVRLVTKWIWPFPGSDVDPLLEAALHGADCMTWKPTKPDTDNMIKAFKDAMTRTRFWEDDAQVVSEITEKFWGMHPGIYVRVEELP